MTHYRNGLMRGELKLTKIETPCTVKGKPSYRWTQRLALLDADGCWILSDSWRSNATKQAHEDLLFFGWQLDEYKDKEAKL